jgi:ADP-ribose pyrophosphatase YjhB (NUDIX family)
LPRVDHYNDPNAPEANSLRVAVSAFVLDDADRLLMIRRTDNDLYALPGGGQEIGETVAQAVVREVAEETGIDVEVTGVIGIYSNPAHVIAYDDGEVRQEFSICFRATPTGGKPCTSNESSEVEWVTRKRLDELNIHPSIRRRIGHGFDERQAAYFT